MSRVIATLVVILALVACSQAQLSICDKYARAKNITDAALISVVVNQVVGTVTTTGNPLKRYFDGSLNPYVWPGATNFTDPSNVVALTNLVNKLNTFFYAGLGCADNTLGPYTGRNMTAAHAAMPIGPVQFEQFNRAVIAVLAGAGVTADDQLTVLGVLNSFKPQICNQPACTTVAVVSICDRYSRALNVTEYDLIDTVVITVIRNVTTAGSPLKKYFDGTIPGTTDFTNPANAAALARLRAHLNQFFGLPAVLGCTAPNFPPYMGVSLVQSHAKLQIDISAFNLFNTVLLNTMSSLGVAPGDITATNAILQTTRSSIVTINGTTTTGVSTGRATTGLSTTTGGRTTTTTVTGSTGVTTSSAATLIFSCFAFFLAGLVYLF